MQYNIVLKAYFSIESTLFYNKWPKKTLFNILNKESVNKTKIHLITICLHLENLDFYYFLK